MYIPANAKTERVASEESPKRAEDGESSAASNLMRKSLPSIAAERLFRLSTRRHPAVIREAYKCMRTGG